MVISIRIEIPLSQIDLNDTRFKARRKSSLDVIQRIARSIDQIGLTNPVKLIHENGKYIVLAGWQRIDAMKYAGISETLADVYSGISEEDAYRINIADNNLRLDINPVDRAYQMEMMKARGYNVKKVADIFGIGVDGVYDHLSLLKMDQSIRSAVEEGKLSLYQAVILNRAPDSERSELMETTLKEGRSVAWLRQELSQIISHPFYNSKIDIYDGEEAHALLFPRTPEVEKFWAHNYDTLYRHLGVAGPLKCEFSMSIPAINQKPHYICENDIKWVVLAGGKYLNPLNKPGKFWKDIPLEERDGWFFFCERCAKYLFPRINFHKDMIYKGLTQYREIN